ncbi:CBR-GUR-5 protein [Ditylenchus destructor]|uniref:CBR-GUR-5 protein n=1 Tax=Ditylenchus destructor TaxID=166010 RepID=A0AAD4QWD3_9BILA|nr:CBR-GUR-5 protein [Ditylenchus destructor]
MMDLVPLLRLTGLYFSESPQATRSSFRTVLASVLTLIVISYTAYGLICNLCGGGLFGGKISASYLNVQEIFYFAMLSESIFSIFFLIKWQLDGSLQFMLRNTLLAEKNKVTVIGRRFRRILGIITGVAILATTFKVCQIILNWTLYFVRDGMELEMEWWFFDETIFAVLSPYAIFVWHICLCLFMAVVQSLTLELQDFNRKFETMLKSNTEKSEELTKKISASFTHYTRLTDKVSRIDRIVGPYAFIMLAAGCVSLIFLLLSTIREHGHWVVLIPFFIDILIWIWHLFGLCVFPTRVYTEVHYVQRLLGRTPTLWNSFDPELYAVANMFADNISRADIGITLWGFTPITKSLVLTCVSLLVSYIVLFLQLKVGSEYESWHNDD